MAFVAPAATHASTSTSRGAGPAPSAGPVPAVSSPQASSSSVRSAGSVIRGARARSAACASRTCSHAAPSRARRGRLGSRGDHQVPRLVRDDQRLLHVPRGVHGRAERAVTERPGVAQSAVEHTAHPASYHHGHRQHRAQALGGDGVVVLVADLPRAGVVRHRARTAQRHRPAAQAVAGGHRERAEGGRGRAVQFADVHLPAARLHQAAEGHREAGRTPQPHQRTADLHRLRHLCRHLLAPSPRHTPPSTSGSLGCALLPLLTGGRTIMVCQGRPGATPVTLAVGVSTASRRFGDGRRRRHLALPLPLGRSLPLLADTELDPRQSASNTEERRSSHERPCQPRGRPTGAL